MSGSWLWAILSSSFCLSLYDLCKKASVRGNAVFPTLFISTLSGWVALTVFLIVRGAFVATLDVTLCDIGRLFVKSCIVTASWTATYFALRTLPITTAAPIRATGPFWTLIGAILFFSEIPCWMQVVGMVLVLGGCLFFSLSSRHEPSSGGMRAAALALTGTVLGSVSALYDKHLMQGLSLAPLTVLWWFLGFMMLMYFLASAVHSRGFTWRWTMPFVGLLLAASDAFYFTAIAVPDAQISVLSLIRRSSIVLTFLIGGALFHETDLRRKACALAAILVGVVILCWAS